MHMKQQEIKDGQYVRLALNDLLTNFPEKDYSFKVWLDGGYIIGDVYINGNPYERYGYKKKGIAHFRQWLGKRI